MQRWTNTEIPATAVKQKAHEIQADKVKGHLDRERRMSNLTGEAKNAAAAAVKVTT